MSTQLTPSQQFQEKMKERVTQGFEDLLPDEMLADLIKRAIDDAFFKRERNDSKTWFEKHVISIVEPLIVSEVNKWLDKPENAKIILQQIEPYLEKSGSDAILSAITSVFSGSVETMKWNIQQDLYNRMNQTY